MTTIHTHLGGGLQVLLPGNYLAVAKAGTDTYEDPSADCPSRTI